MPAHCEIAVGGTLRTTDEEHRLVDALTRVGLPIACQENSDFAAEEPWITKDDGFYEEAVKEAIDGQRPLSVVAWMAEDRSTVFSELIEIFDALGLTWRCYDHNLDKENPFETDGIAQPTLVVRGPAVPPGAAESCLVDEERWPLIRVETPAAVASAIERGHAAFLTATFVLPPLSRGA